MSRPRRTTLLISAAILALVIWGLLPKPVLVETGQVSRGPLRVTIDEEGETRVRQRYTVAAPASGLLQRVPHKPGASVAAGDPLFTLDTADSDVLDARTLAQAQARVASATAARDQADTLALRAAATAQLAQTELARVKTLREQGAASQQDFDRATLNATAASQDARAATFAQQIATHELTLAQTLLTRTAPSSTSSSFPIFSPFAARVLRVHQESAMPVRAGQPILELGDPTDLEIQVDVLSRDAVSLQPGAAVELLQWGGDTPLPARLRLVEPSGFTKYSALGVEEQRVYAIADLLAPPEARPTLGDLYRVIARITLWETADTLRAPAGCFFQKDNQWFTFVLDGRRARLTPVKLGRSNGLETQILEGLSAGDTLILYPGDRVKDGTRASPL